jgi:hypothetical protein
MLTASIFEQEDASARFPRLLALLIHTEPAPIDEEGTGDRRELTASLTSPATLPAPPRRSLRHAPPTCRRPFTRELPLFCHRTTRGAAVYAFQREHTSLPR